ncbi:MAG TPA: hypothetical protein VFH47_01335, partial [Candidatus Thermoplasmatota archaeon]|nr:hypothetical protein [Candidatus Thermoplasmatota archaeon]
SRIAPAAARLLFTAYADTAVAVRAVNEAHIVHFFTKPLDPALLHEVLAAIVAVQAELALQRAATARPHALWQTDPGPPVGAG